MVLRARRRRSSVDPDGLRCGPLDIDEVQQLFDFLEFRTLFDRLAEALGARPRRADVARRSTCSRPRSSRARRPAAAAAARRGSPRPARVWPWPRRGPARRRPLAARSALALVRRRASGRGARGSRRGLLADPAVRAALRTALAGGRPVAAHDAKALMRALLGRRHRRCARWPSTPTLAAYLLDPAETRYAARRPARAATPTSSCPPPTPAPEGQLDLGGDGGRRRRSRPAAGRSPSAASSAAARPRSTPRACARCTTTSRSRSCGCWPAWRTSASASTSTELRRAQRPAGRRVRRAHRADLEPTPARSSTSTPRRSCAQILFDELGLTPQKKTKTGFSTDAASLEKLRGQHPIIEHLLRYREVEKLRSTYGEGLLAEVAPDGRIHATFNQTVARTGRLSSRRSPNLHNIPVRTEEGRAFRQAFVPAAGLRAAGRRLQPDRAALHRPPGRGPGPDRRLRARRGHPHRDRGARSSASSPTTVTIEQRSKAKMVSYGLAYGMEAYGLGQRLNIPTDEAPGDPRRLLRGLPDRAGLHGPHRGRGPRAGLHRDAVRPPPPDPRAVSSSNYRIRQAGERQAMNAGIQGLAADIFKVALVRLDHALEDGGLRQPAHPPGARRGDRRGAARRARRRRRAHARRHGRRRRPARAARGQPRLRPDLGRRQG